jgi:acetate kinase
MTVLVLNGGSTSLKVALLGDGLDRRWSMPTGEVAGFLDRIDDEAAGRPIGGVGHRVVHGGDRYGPPCRITPEVLADLRALSPTDPVHLPLEIALIEEVARRRPRLPQVACFDTAFHASLPLVARLLPLPRRLFDQGVRRYGFHGLSYQWSLRQIERQAGPDAARGRLVLAHLGGGASLAAVRDGRCADTTMGFSPAAGVPMATRSGDVDPGLVAYLARTEGMSAERFARMATEESGLLGVSGTTGDMRALAAAADADGRAAEAIALFCYEVKKRIGAFAAALGGLDRLVFTGGIGEHAPDVRRRICEDLEFLGIALDSERNLRGDPIISSARGRVIVQVIAADEEAMVAEGVRAVLGAEKNG